MAIDSVASFLVLLRELRLLEPRQLDELTRTAAQFPDPRSLARELVQRDWLTPYQVNQLFQGRGADLRLGPYLLLERLGEGGMGQVYKARHLKLNRLVALKVIRKERLASPEAVRRFYREIELAGKLNHRNIALAYDADQAGETHFFAMEYLEGIDLGKLVKQRGPLPVHVACNCIRQAALGLQHAYERGLVHRDLKPSNLLLTSRAGAAGHDAEAAGVVKLLDLGLARLEGPEAGSELTREGVVMGTPDYIAPEQAMSSHSVDIRADLYSLGCTLFYLLTGRPPFGGETFMEKLLKHQVEPPPDIETLRRDVPPGVSFIVQKLLAKQPADRFQTPGELAAALEPFCDAQCVAAAVTRRAPAAGQPPTAAPAPSALQDTEPAWPVEVTPSLSTISGLQRKKAAPGGPRAVRFWLVLGGAGVAVLVLVVVLIALLAAPRGGTAPTSPQPTHPTRGATPSLRVEANRPWQDTAVDVEGGGGTAGKPVTIRAQGTWRMGPHAPACSAEGDPTLPAARTVLPEANPMCLLVRVGDDEHPIPVGQYTTLYPRSSGRLFVQANDLDLDDNSGSLTLEIQGGKRSAAPATPPPPTLVQRADTDWRPLAAQAGTRPDGLRAELLAFGRRYPGTPQALHAARVLVTLPGPLDALDPAKVPAELLPDGPVEQLAAVVGDPRRRHWGPVRCLAVSPGGKTLATGGDDHIIHLWDVSTGRPLQVLKGHTEPVLALAFVGDRQLASASAGGSVKVWDLTKGAESAQCQGHKGAVHALACTADGQTLVTAGADRTRAAVGRDHRQGAVAPQRAHRGSDGGAPREGRGGGRLRRPRRHGAGVGRGGRGSAAHP